MPAAYTGPDNFTSANGVNYTFNNLALNQSASQALCNRQCGHLASYLTAQEQADVEIFYIDNVRGPEACLADAGGCWRLLAVAAAHTRLQAALPPSLGLVRLSGQPA